MPVGSQVMLAANDTGARNLKEFVAYARRKPWK